MINNRIYLSLFIFLLITIKSWSSSIVQQKNQELKLDFQKQEHLTIITGFQSGTYSFAEIGIGYKRDSFYGHHMATAILGISNELKLNKDFVWGLKVGAWSGGGAGTNVGLNLVNYTDFQNNSIRFRPEVGFGFGYFRMIYGYNFAITNKDFQGINEHLFGINIMLDIKEVDGFKLF